MKFLYDEIRSKPVDSIDGEEAAVVSLAMEGSSQ